MMTRNALPGFLSVLFAVALFTPAIIQAQGPAGSSARDIQTEVQKIEPRVDQIIERANDHFRKGKLNLEDNKREQARDEFDKAVDAILMSGLDVRVKSASSDLLSGTGRANLSRRGSADCRLAPQQNDACRRASTRRRRKRKTVEIAQASSQNNSRLVSCSRNLSLRRWIALSKLVLTEDEKKVSSEQLATLEAS